MSKFDDKDLLLGSSVDLSGKNINDVILKKEILPKLARNPNLRELILANNMLGDGGEADIGVRDLVQLLKKHETIVSVDLRNNNIGAVSMSWFKALFAENFCITSLNLDDQKIKTSKPLTQTHYNEILGYLARNRTAVRKKRSNEGLPLRRLSDNSFGVLKSIQPVALQPEPEPESPKSCCVIS